jgi:pyruvate formate lyase activating enzyme
MGLNPEVGVYFKRCIGTEKCGYCIKACPEGEETLISDGNVITGIDREKCTECLACVDACPAEALVVWGKKMTADEVMKVVLSDIDFYRKSDGGVTISGGEPLIQLQFTANLLGECRNHGIHTCVESSLHVKGDIVREILPLTDMIITDIKHMDPEKHRDYTGTGNGLILENIAFIAGEGKPLIIRIPVVPGHNDGDDNIHATEQFITGKLGNCVKQVQLVPYRQMGVEKYASLGRDYPMNYITPPERKVWEQNIKRITERMQSHGIPAVAGTSSKTG